MSKEDAHNKGQSDAAEGKVNPPHSHTEEFFAYGDRLKEIHQDNQAYWEGRNHTISQKK